MSEIEDNKVERLQAHVGRLEKAMTRLEQDRKLLIAAYKEASAASNKVAVLKILKDALGKLS